MTIFKSLETKTAYITFLFFMSVCDGKSDPFLPPVIISI